MGEHIGPNGYKMIGSPKEQPSKDLAKSLQFNIAEDRSLASGQDLKSKEDAEAQDF